MESAYIDRLQRKKVELAREAFVKELQAIDKRLEGKRHKGESEKQCFTRSMCIAMKAMGVLRDQPERSVRLPWRRRV